MLPQNASSPIQRRKPGNRGTVEPSGSLIGPPLACGSPSVATNAAGSAAIFCNSSRGATSPRTLSADQPRSNAALYSDRNSRAGLTSSSVGTLSSVCCGGPGDRAKKNCPGRGRRGLIRSVTRTSVRDVLLRPGGAGHVLARTDRYDVTHADLNIPKRMPGEWVCLRPGGDSSQQFISLDPRLTKR